MKAVCLLSGGIDSPVAAKLAINKDMEVIFLHAQISDKKLKITELANAVCKNPKIFYYEHTGFLKKAKEKCNNRYLCILCKRNMYKEAEKLAIKEGAEFIITGESIGQVASQTLKNIATLNYGIKIPILRPLIGLSKQEIINIAKEIGTYNLSIIDNPKCLFVPNQPCINAKIKDIIIEEEKLK
ncbi:MAG: 7-cyano-7-deazaguanine synthase [Candidatus Nanoarchaeia archaeon]|nr:7-cyano-7-deazaguanine synthase [Candidatus Nanoarchaeia archaeon]